MHILGISCYYHDASACILKDGKIVAAAEEERFTRKKHDIRFPKNAIEYCLKEAGIEAKDLDYVAFYEKPLNKFERILYQHLEKFPRSLPTFLKTTPSWLTEKLRVPVVVKKKTGYEGKIYYIGHHLSHAASAFLVSPFKEAAIFTVDGVGEWATTTLGKGKGEKVEIQKEMRFPHSLGLLYSAVTGYLGFKVNNDEYKVMGLAPYGKPVYYDRLKKLVDLKEDGSFRIDMSYFVYHYKMSMVGKKFIKEFGPVRKREAKLEQKHKDMAASLQKLTEDVIMKMLKHLHKITKCDNLCMAGGVALNSVANGKILKNTPFKRLWVQPAASDAGTSLGAAFYLYNSILMNRRKYRMDSAFLGPGFSKTEMKEFLDSNGIKYTMFKSDKEMFRWAAKTIENDDVIGWFQGRMEWGPRALGSRSILANPCSPKMKDILNLKVKHREAFRPFAPVICADDIEKYFEPDMPLPRPADFMLMVYPIKKNKQKDIPAVVHVDGSGRLQTIRKEQNERYYNVIKEFSRITGVPILVNTSFNIRGEPIVCTPYHAYRCMMGTGIDYVIMDRFLIKREDNPKDMWDSEKEVKE